MMMNYKIVLDPTGADILETTTKQIVNTKPLTYEDAKKMCRNLNLGGGFDAWTPAFFVDNTRFITIHEG